ncbi:MAG: PIG-L family deacetylase [Holophagales bacterium]|nr:PIG-L family deacetylase [Holophagales bacterium]
MPSDSPPGRTEPVHARRVLVLAPHFDDEILGCGGLLIQLVSAGAEVKVLFLTDSAGVRGPAYAEERRVEARDVAAELGLETAELTFPDGGLERHLDELARALEEQLTGFVPDLLLVPSPLETSADHRAAFAGLHRLLGAIRSGAELESAVDELRILVYEVNHTLYPDLLVDVSAEVETLASVMGRYASQEEQHGYWHSALGRRRFRTLTLEPGVEAAEAFRRLEPADFTTRGSAALVAHLGGAPALEPVREGPRISVIVRTKDRPELLLQALGSLARSTYRRLEVVLVNDGGVPPELPGGFPFEVVRVDHERNLGRAAAANSGIAAATGEYVAFLDDDDLVEPEHYEVLARLVSAAGVRVAYTEAAVGVYELDGDEGWKQAERRLPYSREHDPDRLLVDNYIPFHTLLVERSLLHEVGELDTSLPFFEDWDLLIRLAARTSFHHLRRVTCEYRQLRGGGHHVLGDRPRQRIDFLEMKARVLAKHRGRIDSELLARLVDALRAEAVEATEGRRRAREEACGWQERFHQANGRLDAVEGHVRLLEQQLATERQRGDDAERILAEVRADGEARSRELARAYGEIERLDELIRAMESTRAWKLHQALQRWKA